MQVPHSIDTKVQEEVPVRKDQGVSGGGDTKAGGTERKRDIGGTHNERPYPHADKDADEFTSQTSRPKYSVSQVVGYIKGKSAIYVARRFGERKKYFNGQEFWARGYLVSTVGLDEEKVRKYINEQEKSDAQLDLITT